MSGPLYDLALSVPWCCTAEALEAMLTIAARDPLPEDEIARRMHGPKSLALRQGQRREDSGRMTMHGPVAVIPIEGPIFRYADMFTRYSGGITTEGLARDLQAALDDPAVAGILLAIDSPGGESTGINELADTIAAARGRKPIMAYIEGYGASAAYWIASACDAVFVDDTALVGSIGTILGVPDPTKRPATRIDIVSTQSPKKRPDVLTPEGRAILQQMADDMTEVFISKVAHFRGLDRAAILAIEGGMLIGQQAVDAGLADALGSEQRVLEALALGTASIFRAPRKRGITQETTIMPPEKKSFWAGLFEGAREAGLVGAHETAIGTQVAATAAAIGQTTTGTLTAPAIPAVQYVNAPGAGFSAAAPEQDARTAQMAEENAKLRAELDKVRRAQITADAETFVKAQITAGRAYVAEAAALTALYGALAYHEAGIALDAGTNLPALLRAAIEARPANQLSSQLIPNALPAGAVALTNNGGDAALLDDADRSAREYAKRANGAR